MALETLRTLGQLKEECEQKGITVHIKGSKEHKEDYIRALRDYWLEKYYGSIDNAPWALKFMLSIDCPMLCRRYQQCKPEQQKMFWESDDYIVEEKIDGCFSYNTGVLLSDGTTRSIGEIVEKRLPVEVMSLDESTGKLVPRQVVNWFNHGQKKVSQWMQMGNTGGIPTPLRNVPQQANFITKNHIIYYEGEWVEAYKANHVTRVLPSMNKTQIQVMYGSVLGDGICAFSTDKDINAYYEFCNSEKQKDYFDKKVQLFIKMPNRLQTRISGYGSNMYSCRLNACKEATELHHLGYINKTRKITKEYLDIMDTLGLTIWYLDDGSRNKSREELSCCSTNKYSRATFSAYRYSEDDVKVITSWMNERGYDSSFHMTTRNGRKLGYIISLSSKGSQKFFADIARYIPESMSYKIPLELQQECGKIEWWRDSKLEYTYDSVPVKWNIHKSENRICSSTNAYDIEVEGCHSYVANGIIVHNSRSVILFDASTQSFDFYSRNNSVKDYLPQSYKDTIYVTSKDFHYPESFVLDCEVISTNPNISTVMGSRGVVCATQLQATTALLALNPLESKSIQRQYPLKFIIFDCLYDGEDLIDQPWKERHPHAEKLARLLKKAGFSCDLNPVVYKNKLEFYSDVIEQNKEGIIFKNKNAPYHACTSRTIDQVKLKRTISDGLNKDLDAWVSGFIPSDPNKSWSNLIGALVFSCKVCMKDGSIKDHIIGTCSGISLEFRKFATVYVDGKPSLNPDLLGKVATLSGQNISARKLALTHAVIQNWRPDKNPEDCEILEEEELLSMVF